MRLLAQADEAGALDWTVSVDSTMLGLQIRSGLRTAMGAAPTNFTTALDSPDFELAQQLVKDPYVFEHLGPVKSLAERDVAQALMDRLQDTMLQLGWGMAFVGRRVRLSVPDDRNEQVDEFYVDLLFFHVEQLRYVVVEVKVGKFEPAHIGQLGTFVAIVDDQCLQIADLGRQVADRDIVNIDLAATMASRSTIDKAIGMIVAQNRCLARESFAILQRGEDSRAGPSSPRPPQSRTAPNVGHFPEAAGAP